MRAIFVILILGLVPVYGLAQYFVIKVQGEVYADDLLLQPKTQVKTDAQLRFSDEGAYAYVLSTTRGHFILNGKKGNKNRKGEFFAALKDALIPPDQFQAAATRGDEELPTNVFEDKYDLKAFFRDRIVLTDGFAFSVPSTRFPLDDQRYFALRHQFKRKTVDHPLAVADGIVQITPSLMKNKRGKDLRKKIKSTSLVYVDKSKEEEEQVFGPFQVQLLNSADVEQLKEELKLIFDFTDHASLAEFSRVHAQPYLSLHYGKMTEQGILSLIMDFEKGE